MGPRRYRSGLYLAECKGVRLYGVIRGLDRERMLTHRLGLADELIQPLLMPVHRRQCDRRTGPILCRNPPQIEHTREGFVAKFHGTGVGVTAPPLKCDMIAMRTEGTAIRR